MFFLLIQPASVDHENLCSCGEELVLYSDEFSDIEFCPSCEGQDDEYDGQPTEYEEWQDYYGGDDWDHGQYDHYDY